MAELGWRDFARRAALRPSGSRDASVARRSSSAFPGATTSTAFRAWTRGEDGLSDRRRRHAAVMANRVSAQSRAHDRCFVPRQASAHRLATRRGMVLGYARSTPIRPAIRSTGNGSRAWASIPRPTSASSIPCCRPRSSTPTAPMCASWVPELARLEAPAIHSPWKASSEALTRAGVALGADLSAADRRPWPRPRPRARGFRIHARERRRLKDEQLFDQREHFLVRQLGRAGDGERHKRRAASGATADRLMRKIDSLREAANCADGSGTAGAAASTESLAARLRPIRARSAARW